MKRNPHTLRDVVRLVDSFAKRAEDHKLYALTSDLRRVSEALRIEDGLFVITQTLFALEGKTTDAKYAKTLQRGRRFITEAQAQRPIPNQQQIADLEQIEAAAMRLASEGPRPSYAGIILAAVGAMRKDDDE